MTFKFQCASDNCTEHTEVTAGSKTLALRLLAQAGWGGQLFVRCPGHAERNKLMFARR